MFIVRPLQRLQALHKSLAKSIAIFIGRGNEMRAKICEIFRRLVFRAMCITCIIFDFRPMVLALFNCPVHMRPWYLSFRGPYLHLDDGGLPRAYKG